MSGATRSPRPVAWVTLRQRVRRLLHGTEPAMHVRSETRAFGSRSIELGRPTFDPHIRRMKRLSTFEHSARLPHTREFESLRPARAAKGTNTSSTIAPH
jgi:hypothetical protein